MVPTVLCSKEESGGSAPRPLAKPTFGSFARPAFRRFSASALRRFSPAAFCRFIALQMFLTIVSLRPGRCFAIFDQEFPCSARFSIRMAFSSSVHGP
jgi:hypothetical protein